MSEFTARQVDNAVLNIEDNDYSNPWHGVAYEDHGFDSLTIDGETVSFEVVEAQPGREGGGEDIWLVVKVGDQLFKKEGYYASHYGSDWDGDLREVEAVKVEVTKYVTKAGGL